MLLRRRLLYSLAHGHTGAARRAASDWVRSEYLQNILSARVYDVADETPLQYAPVLSSSLGHNVYLKREDLQPVFSFKLRGAYNCIANLTRDQQNSGVVACSAGNHAQLLPRCIAARAGEEAQLGKGA